MNEIIPYNFYSKLTGRKVVLNIISEGNKVSIEVVEPKFLRHLDSTYIEMMKKDVLSMVWSQVTMIVLDSKKEDIDGNNR